MEILRLSRDTMRRLCNLFRTSMALSGTEIPKVPKVPTIFNPAYNCIRPKFQEISPQSMAQNILYGISILGSRISHQEHMLGVIGSPEVLFYLFLVERNVQIAFIL